MDEEKIPKELANKITILLLIIIFQAILLSYFRAAGLFFVFGVISLLFVFSMKDKQLKKQHQNNLLKNNDSWHKSKYNLTKEIP